MKKLLILGFLFIFLMSGCSQAINLDNIQDYETEYKYSKVSGGKIKECSEDAVISDIKDFTNKYLSVVFNRSYKDNRTLEHETIMYSESYLEKNQKKLEDEISYVKDFYKEYELTTEFLNVDFEKIINVNGHAYVTCVAKIKLISCSDMEVAKILGFGGVNGNVPIKYNLKFEYKDRAYSVYDYNVVEEDGYLKPFTAYEEIINASSTEEEKLRRLAFLLSKAQNDRVYYEFSGDEDYKYLTKTCIAEINKERDNAKYIKDLYTKYKLSTKLEKCDVKEIIKTEAGYTIRLSMAIKILECSSKEMAVNLGFTNGVGSTRHMEYEYYVVLEDGEYKVDGTKFLGGN